MMAEPLDRRPRLRGAAPGARSCAAWVVALCCLAASARAQTPPPAATPAPALPVQLRAGAEPQAVTIGEPFRYQVEIAAPRDVELVIPLLGDRFGDFHVTDFGDTPPRADGDTVRVKRWFTLVAYSPGERVIPAFQIKYRLPGEDFRDLQADEVPLTVSSLLARDPSASDIRDIAPPREPPRDWRPAARIGAVTLAALAAIAGLYFGLNRRRSTGPPALRPAHEVALEALARLRARNLIPAGQREEYYVTLSAIVRTYVESRFGLRAPEMTTEEFLLAMQRDRRLTPEHRSLLGAFLTESDLVKFARHEPTADAAERAYDVARRFVEESRLAPAAEEVRRAAA